VANDVHAAALQAIDRLLAERPEKVGPDFSEATRRLVALRDAQIERSRLGTAKPEHRRLAAINAVLSVVIGGHFPLGGIPWPQIEKAREALARLDE